MPKAQIRRIDAKVNETKFGNYCNYKCEGKYVRDGNYNRDNNFNKGNYGNKNDRNGPYVPP